MAKKTREWVDLLEETASGVDPSAGAVELLEAKARQLDEAAPLSWRFLGQAAPRDPASLRLNKSWPAWDAQKSESLRKNKNNWFYAELAFPRARNNVELAATSALINVMGYAPFTLWIDGREMYKEEHAWFATGPIFEPLPMKITPGQRHRFVLRFEPTELPAGLAPKVQFKFAACVDLGTLVDAAAAQLRMGRVIARRPAEARLVENAAKLIDRDAAVKEDWPRLLRSIERMEKALTPLSAQAKEHVVHLLGHCHIDMDWMWTWKDTVHCIRRDFKAITQLMADVPQVTFIQSMVPIYDVARQKDPAVFAKVKGLIKEGRWENAASTWVENDLNMADGEAIARQFLYATDWARKHLGNQSKVFWAPDTFGHPGNMPQLARLGEQDSYFHWRCGPGGPDNWPVRVWEGVDGTKILAFSNFYNARLDPHTIATRVEEHARFGLKNALHVWGLGDHGGGICRHQLHLLDLYRDKPLIPTFKFGTMRTVLADTQREVIRGGPRLPTNKGETHSLFEGCFTTHAEMKRLNRRCEGALLTAETLSVLAGRRPLPELREAWTASLFNQFHDILDGAAVHDSYKNANARAHKTLRITDRLTKQALATRTRLSITGATLELHNPLGFARTEPVRVEMPASTKCVIDAWGTVEPVQRWGKHFVFIARDVPAMGRKIYRIAARFPAGYRPPELVRVFIEKGVYEYYLDFFQVETDHGSARLSQSSGTLAWYYDKDLKKEIIRHGSPKWLTHIRTTRKDLAGNVFEVTDEAPNIMAAWLIHDPRKRETLMTNAKVTLEDAGPVFARFRVRHRFRGSAIDEQVIFYKKFPRVDFQCTINWKEKGSPQVGIPQLKVAFGTPMTAARARFEGPFFVTERPADGEEQPSQKWTDLEGDEFGFTLLNDSRYGFDAQGGRLRMTLLRNGYAPDADSDRGVHTVRFAFAPHAPGKRAADLVREGMAFNRPFLAVRSAGAARGRPANPPGLTIEGADSVVCTALRPAEHSQGVVIRFFETSGKPATIRFRIGRRLTAVRTVNFLENPAGDAPRLRAGTAEARLRGFEVKSFLVTFTP